MSRPKLVIQSEKCTGCRVCEIVCSLKSINAVNPRRAKIRVESNYLKGIDNPIVCCQCENPVCISVCPVDAIKIDQKLEIPVVDKEKCTSCHLCVEKCPFKAIFIDPQTKLPLKCDLCSGDPQCIKFCVSEAVTFAPQNIE